MLQNLKIGTKILVIILIISLFSLFFISVVSYTEMLNLRRYSTDANTQLSSNSSEGSKNALKKQAEEYIVKIAREQALKSDAVLYDVQRQIAASGEYITTLYQQQGNFKGKKVMRVQDTVMGVPCAKYMLAPGVKQTSAVDRELMLISNAEYMLAPIYKNNSILDNIYLGTRTGISYRYSKYNNFNPEYDPRERGWYKEAMAHIGTPIWVDTYVDAYNIICVTNAVTFNDAAGKPQGVLATDITLKSMQDDILSMRIGKTGYAFLLDNNGNIIAHPKYGTKNFDTTPLKNAKGDYLEAIKTIVAKTEGLTTAHIDDKLCYIAYSKLPTTKWSLGIVVEEEEIIKPAMDTKKEIDAYSAEAQSYINDTLKSVLIRLVIVLAISAMLILVFSYLVSRTITNPIKVLLAEVGKIGEGELDTKIDIGGKDEIAELANAFNKMTIDLKTYIANISRITAEKERIGAELDVAKKIQTSMLPSIFPAFPEREEFDIYATMCTAKEVGGDFYDFFFIDDDHLALDIADVSGKGVPAALFMVIAKTLIKNNAHEIAPHEVFEKVNNLLCENNDAAMFVTAFMGILEISTGKFTYVNAGHNPPLLKRFGGDFDWLPTKPGLVLAGMEDMVYRDETINLEPGDVLYMYTDGVTEAINIDGGFFTDDKLLRDINKNKDCSIEELLANIKLDIDEFAKGAEQADDITMLGLKINKGR